jgi:hypothetical protein
MWRRNFRKDKWKLVKVVEKMRTFGRSGFKNEKGHQFWHKKEGDRGDKDNFQK